MKEWHKQAIELKLNGVSMSEIARRFGKHQSQIWLVTKGVKGPVSSGDAISLALRGKKTSNVTGFKMGRLVRVAVGFTPEQFQILKEKADGENTSFAKVVCDIVEQYLKGKTDEQKGK